VSRGGSTAAGAAAGSDLRLFVAIALPDGPRERLAGVVERARRRLPAARWVPPANWHLTLAFLGELAPDAVAALDRELGPAFARHDRLRLSLGAAGGFPPGRPARVAWIGLRVEPPAAADTLAALQAAVVDAVASGLGEPAEAVAALRREQTSRGFHPHLTLARMDPAWDLPTLRRFATSLDEGLLAGQTESFAVAEGLLLASELGGGAPRYRVLSRYPLRTDAGGDG
jgi:2'-5' RNA ligase